MPTIVTLHTDNGCYCHRDRNNYSDDSNHEDDGNDITYEMTDEMKEQMVAYFGKIYNKYEDEFYAPPNTQIVEGLALFSLKHPSSRGIPRVYYYLGNLLFIGMETDTYFQLVDYALLSMQRIEKYLIDDSEKLTLQRDTIKKINEMEEYEILDMIENDNLVVPWK